MVIAVNIRSWKKQPDEWEVFIRRLVLRLVAGQQVHRFYLVSDGPLHLAEPLPAHASLVVLGPAGKSLLLQKYWLDIRLPGWLKKVKADVLVNLDGLASLTTKVPQCLLLPDLPFSQAFVSNSKTWRAYYQRQLPRFLQKTKQVVVPSVALQEKVMAQYQLVTDHTACLSYAVADGFHPVPYEVAETVKARYTGGHEYFLYKGLLHEAYNLVNLLKAFSFFKKRQQSSWKLLLAGPFKEGNNAFQQLLTTYKYKDDVVVTGMLTTTEEHNVVASAYALVSPATSETVNPVIWEAMRCEVPVLAAATETNKALLGDSVFYFDGNDSGNMAEWIMHLYRQEGERNAYIEKGRQAVSGLTWEQAAATLWQCVVQAANA